MSRMRRPDDQVAVIVKLGKYPHQKLLSLVYLSVVLILEFRQHDASHLYLCKGPRDRDALAWPMYIVLLTGVAMVCDFLEQAIA